jgi:hypothetical protein
VEAVSVPALIGLGVLGGIAALGLFWLLVEAAVWIVRRAGG